MAGGCSIRKSRLICQAVHATRMADRHRFVQNCLFSNVSHEKAPHHLFLKEPSQKVTCDAEPFNLLANLKHLQKRPAIPVAHESGRIGCPTWIRTMTEASKGPSATITPSDKTALK